MKTIFCLLTSLLYTISQARLKSTLRQPAIQTRIPFQKLLRGNTLFSEYEPAGICRYQIGAVFYTQSVYCFGFVFEVFPLGAVGGGARGIREHWLGSFPTFHLEHGDMSFD